MPRYLLTNEVIQTNIWKMLETNPAYSQDLTTKAKVGKSAVCTYFRFIPGTTNSTSGDFPDISLSKTGWRTENPILGKISAGTWTFKVAIYNDTRYGFSIKVAVRISKSVNADGSDATLIAVSESPNVLALPASAGAIVTDSWTWSGSDIYLLNEYLFVEFRLHIEVAATNTSAQCSFICDEDPATREESVTIPEITPIGQGSVSVVQDMQRPFAFYANGRHWVFYVSRLGASRYLSFRSSTDGVNWSSETYASLSNIYKLGDYMFYVYVFFDGTYVHYALCNTLYTLYYRRGTPNSDGTITWHADEQTVYTGDASNVHRPDSITKDSNGYIWIGTTKTVAGGGGEIAYAWKNNRTDQYWETASGFPYALSGTDTGYCPKIIPLTGGKIYALYSKYAGATYYDVCGRLYDGGWSNEETHISGQYLYGYDWFDGASIGDDVYLVYCAYNTDATRFRKRTYGAGWGDEATIEARQYPVLTRALKGSSYILLCFWCRTDTDKTYYKKYENGYWDTDPSVFTDDTAEGITAQQDIRSYLTNYDSNVGIAYLTNTPESGKYYVRYAYTTVVVGVDGTDRLAFLKTFYAVGRFWLFYIVGTTVYFRTSTDGVNWSSRTSVTQVIDWLQQEAQNPEVFTIRFDGTYVHYAVLKSDYTLYYRRGTPNSDGTITWHTTTEQLVATGASDNLLFVSDITKDSNGYVWIAVDNYYALGYDSYVYKNNRTDEYWETASGFPYLLGTTYAPQSPRVLALTGGKVYCLYHQACPSFKYYNKPYGKLYTGSWGSAETDFFTTCVTSGWSTDAFAVGDDVYYVGVDYVTVKIKFNKRTYGVGWGQQVEVASVQSADTVPCLTYTPNIIYCFWQRLDDDKIYYKRYISGVWDTDPTVYLDESAEGLSAFHTIEVFDKNYDSYVGEAHMTRTTSPYAIKFSAFTPVLVTKTKVAFEFPMSYLSKPVKAKELRSKVEGATVTVVAKDFPLVVKEKNKQGELTSKFG